MARIDRYMEEWVTAVRGSPNVSALARQCGRSHAIFAKACLGLGVGGFNPTYQLLRDVEPFLDIVPKVTALTHRRAGTNSHDKAYLPLLGGLEFDDAIVATHGYLEQLRAERRRLREEDVDFGYLRSLAEMAKGGDVSAHLVTFDPEFGRSYFSRWDTVADYRGGRDFTGARIAELGDEGLTSCLQEDFEDISETGWPQVSVLHRNHSWQAKDKSSNGRVFLRYMCRLEGVDDRPKILAVRSLQVGAASDQLVKGLFS